MDTRTPTTLLDAVRFFKDPDVCLQFMVTMRWPDGVVKCPRCGSTRVGFLANQRRWQCSIRHDRRQFSVKVGTIFEDSPLGLDKWLPAVWQIVNCKNGISSYETARALGITQKSAWFLNHRIRKAMQAGTFEKVKGQVEADETFIGGLARFMHNARDLPLAHLRHKSIGRLRRATGRFILGRLCFDFFSVVWTPRTRSFGFVTGSSFGAITP